MTIFGSQGKASRFAILKEKAEQQNTHHESVMRSKECRHVSTEGWDACEALEAHSILYGEQSSSIRQHSE
jgi:hypothetical protein